MSAVRAPLIATAPPLMPADAAGAALSPADDRTILRLWNERHDTVDIARRMNRSEAQIANRLAQLRDEDGTAMTPTQYTLHHARKRRLARLAAAARPQPPEAARVAEPMLDASEPKLAPGQPRRSAALSPNRAAAARLAQLAAAATLPPAPSARAIQLAVCTYYDVTLQDLLSPRRHAGIVRPRQVAVYLCRTVTALSMPKIGALFGDRDHTTILAAIRKVTEQLPRDDELRLDVEVLTDQLLSQLEAGEGAP
ncbi:helix-turn-helix domain-containing protein [Bradyrhizobium sp. 2TAF24]|uniref:helix-turn-helix domain-containing protein n=1 Tax=Bradyrhizobium sp. 2TAF24 TaxID=3233011 RepID=UPI003F922D89